VEFRKKDEVKKRETYFEKNISNPTAKDKIIMTLFLKAKWENIIMANEIDPAILLPFCQRSRT
jgi:hypothetical protein